MIVDNEHGIITLSAIPFLLLQASVLLVLTTHFSWAGLGLCLVSWVVRQWGITGGYHRYFSHKTYKMGRVMQFIVGFIGAASAQKGPLWWAAHHRQHHAHSDTERDWHTPKKGWWHSHWNWFLYEETRDCDYNKIVDFSKYPELRFLDNWWIIPVVSWAVACFAIGHFTGTGAYHMLVWGFFVSTFILQNATYTINSLAHIWGKRRYHTGDTSRNNWVLAFFLLGEGWHNNHHKYQQAARNGFYWYEYDFTFYGIKLLSWLGLAWDLKPVPEKILEEGRRNDRARKLARRRGEKWLPPVSAPRAMSPAMAGK